MTVIAVPDIAQELPAIFQKVGFARVLTCGCFSHHVLVEINLYDPVSVAWPRGSVQGICVAAHTKAVQGLKPGINPVFTMLPNNGDYAVRLWLHLALYVTDGEGDRAADILRSELCRLARALAQPYMLV